MPQPDTDFVAEDHCELCGGLSPDEREVFRANLDRIRLRDDDAETICKKCFLAFWRNLGFPVTDDDLPGQPRKLTLVRQNKAGDDKSPDE